MSTVASIRTRYSYIIKQKSTKYILTSLQLLRAPNMIALSKYSPCNVKMQCLWHSHSLVSKYVETTPIGNDNNFFFWVEKCFVYMQLFSAILSWYWMSISFPMDVTRFSPSTPFPPPSPCFWGENLVTKLCWAVAWEWSLKNVHILNHYVPSHGHLWFY